LEEIDIAFLYQLFSIIDQKGWFRSDLFEEFVVFVFPNFFKFDFFEKTHPLSHKMYRPEGA